MRRRRAARGLGTIAPRHDVAARHRAPRAARTRASGGAAARRRARAFFGLDGGEEGADDGADAVDGADGRRRRARGSASTRARDGRRAPPAARARAPALRARSAPRSGARGRACRAREDEVAALDAAVLELVATPRRGREGGGDAAAVRRNTTFNKERARSRRTPRRARLAPILAFASAR